MSAIRRALALGATGLLALASCTSGEGAAPAPTTRPDPTTTVVDRSGIRLAAVPGSTTSTIVETGHAVLTGTVRGPDGPVPGATVRIERLVAGTERRTDVLTGADGRFVLAGVPGGPYRVRAFLPPTLVQLQPEVRFLADGEEHTFDLVVEARTGLVVRADVAPEPPLAGEPVNLVARVSTLGVDADGVVRALPLVGATVELVGLGRWELRDDRRATTTTTTTARAPTSTTRLLTTTTTEARTVTPTRTARTDGAGQVRFELVCASPGPPGLALRVPVPPAAPPGSAGAAPTVETVALDVPDCVAPGGAPSGTSTSTSSP